MATIAITTSLVGKSTNAIVFTAPAAAAINAGQPVVFTTNGVTPQTTITGACPGVALNTAAAKQAVQVLVFGHLPGADVDSLTPGAGIFIGASGTLDTTDAPATQVGFVGYTTDGLKVAFIDCMASAVL